MGLPIIKPKVAFFDFACCEGCQIEVTNLGTDLAAVLGIVDLVEFREAMTETTTERIDISFIEGSFTREADRKRLEDIRNRSNIVVAYGSCATIAGINALKNRFSSEEYKNMVYGKDMNMPHLDSQEAQPISAVIKVDYKLHGCPVNRNELAKLIVDLVHGKEPFVANSPVCVECKLRETVCRYDVGDYCMGPIARAGCGAPCPADGIPCEACRGCWDHPNLDSIIEVMTKAGVPADYAKVKGEMFTHHFFKEKDKIQR